MGYCARYGYKDGQVEKLTAPIDAGGNFCGIGKMKGYPKMFIAKWAAHDLAGIFKSGLCVKTCPTSKTHKFKEDVDCKTAPNVKNLKTKCSSSMHMFPTRDIGDYCLPKSVNDLKAEDKAGFEAVKKNFFSTKAGSLFVDMYLSSRAIYISMAMSIVYSLVFIYLLSWFAETIAWCCVVLIQLGLIGLAVGCFLMRQESAKYVAGLEKDST